MDWSPNDQLARIFGLFAFSEGMFFWSKSKINCFSFHRLTSCLVFKADDHSRRWPLVKSRQLQRSFLGMANHPTLAGLFQLASAGCLPEYQPEVLTHSVHQCNCVDFGTKDMLSKADFKRV